MNPESLLAQWIALAVSYGATCLEVEYKDGYEEVCAMKNHIGIGIARLPSDSEEAVGVRKLFSALGRKGTSIPVNSVPCRVRTETYNSFCGKAWRVRFEPEKQP